MTITRMQEPRQMYQQGGIMQVAPRQGYFLGKLVKSIGKGVKKIVKSPIGKAAILGLGAYGLGGGLGGKFSLGTLGSRLGLGTLTGGEENVFAGGPFSAIANLARDKFGNLSTGTKLGLGGAFASYLMSTGASEEDVEEIKRDKGKLSIYLKDYFTKLNPNASDEEVDEFVATNTSEFATGGRVGFADGSYTFEQFMQDKGKVDSYMNQEQMRKLYEKMMREKKIREQRTLVAMGGMPTGIMRTNQAGTIERDYRDEGGFVPVGIKEKADDVPAMLSKNEFVMTADAVRGMGNGSIEKGAQRLYDQMKRLENKVA